MHRRKLLNLLREYGDRYPEEAETADRFVAFVKAHHRCFDRDLWAGHITGSAWIVDTDGTDVLLTHHKKLDIWVQLGGHSDSNPDTAVVAQTEATEESGLAVRFVDTRIFDLDIHQIPARKNDPAHFHYDVRFAFMADERDYVVSSESNALAWVGLSMLEDYSQEASLLRMRRKWLSQTPWLNT